MYRPLKCNDVFICCIHVYVIRKGMLFSLTKSNTGKLFNVAIHIQELVKLTNFNEIMRMHWGLYQTI